MLALSIISERWIPAFGKMMPNIESKQTFVAPRMSAWCPRPISRVATITSCPIMTTQGACHHGGSTGGSSTHSILSANQAFGFPAEGRGSWCRAGILLHCTKYGCRSGHLPQIFSQPREAMTVCAQRDQRRRRTVNMSWSFRTGTSNRDQSGTRFPASGLDLIACRRARPAARPCPSARSPPSRNPAGLRSTGCPSAACRR
jgi:hypothetical protein